MARKQHVQVVPPQAAGSSGALTPEMEAVRQQFLALRQEGQGAFYERDVEVDAVITTLVAKQHAFILGPPGTAKSLLARFLAKAVSGAKYYEVLCMTTTPPEEFFGPTSVKGLLEDRFERCVDGYLPDAEIAFLDEYFKCNAASLNGLLTILNEREFKNGKKVLKVPLLTALAASNELPQEDNLRALFDRTLVRLSVHYLQELANVVALLTTPARPIQTSISLDDLKAAIADAATVEVPQSVAAQAAMLREKVAALGIQCSDRRIKQANDLVRAHAWLAGRKKANVSDLEPLRHVFWETENQIPKVFDIVMEVVNPMESKSREIVGNIRIALKEIEKAKPENQINVAVESIGKCNEGIEQLEDLIAQALKGGHDAGALEAAITKAQAEVEAVKEKYIGSKLSGKRKQAN